MNAIGHFLEISVRTTDILESLHFYKTLGFAELEIGGTPLSAMES
jgi:hypothetical protein